MTDDGRRWALLVAEVRHRRRLVDGEPEDVRPGVVASDVEAVLLRDHPPQIDLRSEDPLPPVSGPANASPPGATIRLPPPLSTSASGWDIHAHA